jgi:hypothetical protein
MGHLSRIGIKNIVEMSESLLFESFDVASFVIGVPGLFGNTDGLRTRSRPIRLIHTSFAVGGSPADIAPTGRWRTSNNRNAN